MANIVDLRSPCFLNLDSSPALLKELETFFSKNLTDKPNQKVSGLEGENAGLLTPLQATVPACIEDLLPTNGINRCIGSFESTKSNENYYFNYNTAGNHGIYRISNDGCVQVYLGSCLNFQPEEKYAIAEHRVHLAVVSNEQSDERKFLIFTDGFNPIRFIDVETSIATNSFNATDFPYWATFYPFCDPCEYIELATRPPYDCPQAELIPFNSADANLPNKLVGETFQFRYRYILTDGRVTTFSPISELFYVPFSICNNAVGESRCIKLTLNAGSALVEKIQIAFRTCNGDASNPDTPTDWFLYDTIDKYDSCVITGDFWLRSIALNDYCVPDGDCTCAGTFNQTTWTWDMSGTAFPRGVGSIGFNGNTLTSTLPNDSLLEFVEWLNTLGIGEFLLTATTITLVTDSDDVYGDIVTQNPNPAINTPITVTPTSNTIAVVCEANTFEYIFCADKQCITIAIADTDRDYDNVPRRSWALTPINNKIALGNNLIGFNPVDCVELDKFNFGFEFPAGTGCNVPFYKVSGWFVIHNLANAQNVGVSDFVSIGRCFGGYCNPGGGYFVQTGTPDAYGTGYGQGLPDNAVGFIVYANKYIFTRTVQKQYNSNTGVLSDFGLDGNFGDSYNNLTNGIYLVQYFEFYLPRGNYSFRIASQSATSSSFETTSTYTIGFVPSPATDYDPLHNYSAGDFTIEKEVVIQVCQNDVQVNDTVGTLIVADLTDASSSPAHLPFVLTGYLFDKKSQPVELAYITPEGGGETIDEYTQWTDHNGFWFIQWIPDGDTPPNTTIDWNVDMAGVDHIGVQWTQVNYPNKANFVNRIVTLVVDGCAYEDAYAILTGDVKDCNTGGLENIPVVVKHTHIVYTDINGHYEVHLRGYVHFDNTRGWDAISHDIVIIEQNLACLLMGCGDDCDVCFDPIELHNYLDTDFDCGTTPFDEGINTYDLFDQQNRGVKSGQKYLIGWKLHDKNKRHTFIQHRDAYDLQIPFITNYPVDIPPTLFWQLSALPTIPPEFQDGYISFYITLNPVLEWLQWAVSKVEYLDGQGNPIVDSSGNPLSIGAVKMRISVEGLNNYNSENNFQTNTVFEFEKGDMVKFIDDGAGNRYNTELIDLQVTGSGNVTTPINPPAPDPLNNPALPDNPAQSFIIDFDSRLTGLKAGSWIEMYRPAPCENTKFFYETCRTLPIIAGKIQVDCSDAEINTHYTINFFDTYLLRRAIPQNDASGSPSVLNVAHPYEHHSPSDFCCTKCADIGRPNVINPYEGEAWHRNTISYSDSIDFVSGLLNGLSTFREGNERSWYQQEWGDIIAIHAERNMIAVVCQYDWYKFPVADLLVRVNEDGTLRSGGAEYFGQSDQKVRDKYGAQYDYPRTIIFYDGLVHWIDVRNSMPIICNYGDAERSDINVTSYFYNKIKFIREWNENSNNTEKYIIHSGVDPLKNMLLVTFIKIKSTEQENTYYGNDLNHYDVASNESMVYDIELKAWRPQVSYNPEAYGKLRDMTSGNQLISFAKGIPYLHNDKSVVTFNTFYGVAYQKYTGIVSNKFPDNVKRYTNMSIECSTQSWRAEFETLRGAITHIPFDQFKFREGIFYHEIPTATNSPVVNGLLAIADGIILSDQWCKILLSGDPNNITEYCELKNITVFSFSSERTNK